MMHLNTIKDLQSQFGITEIFSDIYLSEWQRTAFSWTERPNSVCLAMDKKYLQQALNNPNITGIITTAKMQKYISEKSPKTVIISNKANQLFYYLHNQAIHQGYSSAENSSNTNQIHPSTQIAKSAIIGKNITIGKNCTIHDSCHILDNTIIGDNCSIFNLVTIGTEGFFSKTILDKKSHIKHFGGVKIGNNCIVHTGTNISKSVNSNEYTELADNVHIGIHSNIGHDSKIGINSDISAKVMIAGRVTVGENCWLGATSTISNALNIGDNTTIKIGSVVVEDIAADQTVSGNFAMSHLKNLKKFLKTKN